MTGIDATNPLDNRLIDQIVDGALTPAELRAAIDHLDQDADGWRRCALAFLEAQCWGQSMRSFEPAAQLQMARHTLSPPPGAPAGAGRHWVRGPIAAAIIAVSFALGWLGHAVRTGPGVGETLVARSGVQIGPGLTGSHGQPATADDRDSPESTARTASIRRQQQTLPTVNEVVRAVARLHIESGTRGADVPILAGPGINEKWLKNQPPPVTEYDQVALKRRGYHVDQRRQFFTTILADGRRVAVPVDQVQIRYTGNDPL